MQFKIYYSSVPDIKKTFENFYCIFLWVGFKCLKATAPFQEDCLIAKSPGIPGTHLISLRRMKDWVNLGAAKWL